MGEICWTCSSGHSDLTWFVRQSNMWLPMLHTFSRNYTVANISAGKYSNIRLMAGDSQQSATFPWMTAAQSIADGNESVPDYSLFKFSGACWWAPVPHSHISQSTWSSLSFEIDHR